MKTDAQSIKALSITGLLLFSFAVLPLWNAASAQQPRADLYLCEGCEAIYEHSFEGLSDHAVITEAGEPLILTGTVFRADGEIPAPGVIVYAYHTNAEGVYPTRGDEKGWARRHGYLRGWVKTNSEGRYRFDTIRPSTYPNRREPAHIHMTIKEPDFPEYWIDAVVFADDPLVTAQYRKDQGERGGSGIVKLTRDAEGRWVGVRDIVLERHPPAR